MTTVVNKDQGVALVTGASGGLGRTIAERLANSGYRVFGTGRSADQSKAPAGVEMVALDVTRDASVKACIDEIAAKTGGRLDILVNNAGVAMMGAIEETSIEQAHSIFETNFFGVVRVTQAVLPLMRKQGKGRIVNISSVVGLWPAPYMGFYSASKFAVEGYSEALDHEVRTRGIRVVLIEPAFMKTNIGHASVRVDGLPAYQAERERSTSALDVMSLKADPPENIAELVMAAALAKSPRLRWPAGRVAKQLKLMSRFLPNSMFDSGLRQAYGLDKFNG